MTAEDFEFEQEFGAGVAVAVPEQENIPTYDDAPFVDNMTDAASQFGFDAAVQQSPAPVIPVALPQLVEQPAVKQEVAVREAPAEAPALPPLPPTATHADRALRLLSDKDSWKQSEAKRTAAIVRSNLAQADAVDRQTAVLSAQLELIAAQTAALTEQNRLTDRLVTEQRISNQLQFFAMKVSDFATQSAPELDPASDGTPREHVHTQMKRNLGILPPLPSAVPAGEPAEENEPSTTHADDYDDEDY